MKTSQVPPENLPRQQEPSAKMPSASDNPASNTTFKRKSKTANISDEVVSYYQHLLDEHNSFIRQNSSTTYRIL